MTSEFCTKRFINNYMYMWDISLVHRRSMNVCKIQNIAFFKKITAKSKRS